MPFNLRPRHICSLNCDIHQQCRCISKYSRVDELLRLRFCIESSDSLLNSDPCWSHRNTFFSPCNEPFLFFSYYTVLLCTGRTLEATRRSFLTLLTSNKPLNNSRLSSNHCIVNQVPLPFFRMSTRVQQRSQLLPRMAGTLPSLMMTVENTNLITDNHTSL